jgi:acetyl esterase/lipase
MVASILLLALGLAAALGALNAARPSQRWWTIMLSWSAAWVVLELSLHLIAFSALAAVVLVALGALEHTAGVIGLVLLVAADVAGVVWALTAQRSRSSLRDLLSDLDPEPDAPRFPRLQIVFPFLMLRARGVRHRRGVVYARDGRRPLKLDVYLPTAPADGPRPAIVQVHGGAWVLGSRKEQGIPLLNHLAANGWVGFNIDYRMAPFHTWPAPVVDVKRAIAWVREHAEEYGVDPDFIALTGGSAGGHLAALAALTDDDRSLQPGFEDADTSVQAAVPFYGVYDMVDEDGIHLPLLHSWVLEPLVFKARRDDDPDAYRAASPVHRVHAGAPPFLVIHGSADSLVPVADARRFVERLRGASDAPVIYAELRGGQHAFDFVPSPRTAPMVEAIERFLHTVRQGALTQTGEEYATAAPATRARTNT